MLLHRALLALLFVQSASALPAPDDCDGWLIQSDESSEYLSTHSPETAHLDFSFYPEADHFKFVQCVNAACAETGDTCVTMQSKTSFPGVLDMETDAIIPAPSGLGGPGLGRRKLFDLSANMIGSDLGDGNLSIDIPTMVDYDNTDEDPTDGMPTLTGADTNEMMEGVIEMPSGALDSPTPAYCLEREGDKFKFRHAETGNYLSASPTGITDPNPEGNTHDMVVATLNTTLGNFNIMKDPKCGDNTGSSHGDPHFKTWSGHSYDFHGGCDLVLMKNPLFAKGKGMRVHIRTQITNQWSFIASAVVQIGEDTLEVTGGLDGGKFWINGKEGESFEDDVAISGFKAHFKQVTKVQKVYRIDLGGDALSLETFKSFVRINAHAKSPNAFMGSVGLMGTYPFGTMTARDGKTVIEDPIKYGQEWQVISDEPMLFHSLGDGVHHPAKCVMPDATEAIKAKKIRRRLGEVFITKEEAAQACARVDEADRDACIFDVLATNDKDMAGSY